jgi:hypothetical protein
MSWRTLRCSRRRCIRQLRGDWRPDGQPHCSGRLNPFRNLSFATPLIVGGASPPRCYQTKGRGSTGPRPVLTASRSLRIMASTDRFGETVDLRAERDDYITRLLANGDRFVACRLIDHCFFNRVAETGGAVQNLPSLVVYRARHDVIEHRDELLVRPAGCPHSWHSSYRQTHVLIWGVPCILIVGTSDRPYRLL